MFVGATAASGSSKLVTVSGRKRKADGNTVGMVPSAVGEHLPHKNADRPSDRSRGSFLQSYHNTHQPREGNRSESKETLVTKHSGATLRQASELERIGME